MVKHPESSSQAEALGAAAIAVRHFKHAIFAESSNFFIAKVVKYDKVNHLADVQPLAKLSTGQTVAQYLELPVVESCYLLDEMVDALKPEFAKADQNHTIPAHIHTNFVGKMPKRHFMRAGVPVVCAVLDRDNDNWGGGRSVEAFEPNSSRMHDANDAVVIGVLGGTWLDG
ncbi:hypothetical protein [Lactobacillus amylovorus]|uniref:hypothetical protein n=1 Tax=Lactobacillus amylovorus TaxID=1604 RepID=UPI00232FAD37|nr:hypothetical protein [Lactobacillus amylovorus]MDB6263641.1 hypothetical protein [Lactobacillus amylovorus]MDB6265335.1 hypothetical protein [Lactobacillus amylovorus]MDB6269112.1 hypothetical protein [Lactobacillus amylovorus]